MQLVQALAPGLAYWPATQFAHVEDSTAAEADEAVPAGQTAQPVAPVFDWNVPATQTADAVEPVADWNVPGVQAEQLNDPVLA